MVKAGILKLLICLMFGVAGQAFAADSADLLPAEQAFQFTSKVKKSDKLLLSWDIANGYYLYRNKFKFVSLTPDIKVGEQIFPPGHTKQDKFFGDVEIFRDHLEVEVALQRQDPKQDKLVLEVTFQGCADAGVCYMPVQQTVSFDLADESFNWWGMTSGSDNLAPFISEQDSIAASLADRSLWLIILSFLGFGLLLAFTPCVFPMIPILSGIIVGQGARLTTRRAFVLSLAYVFASAVTYTIFGVLAGLFGSNLQAFFLEPWAIIAFSGIFVLLACSMFGVFHLQMPAFVQSRIVTISAKQRGGNLLGAAVMGMLSALAVGPCITAPLAGALIYIGQTGDAMLGGLALFSLGIGMGLPLLIIGTSAGKLLPKTGVWMNVTKAVFGVGLLAVAIWLLGRVMPEVVTQSLWLALLMIPLMYLGWKKLWKGAGLVALTYAIFLLVGIATHQQRDAMQLLCVAAIACAEQPKLPFQQIKSADELQQTLAEAHAQGRWVMLDFYADWCALCKEMELYTFSDPDVKDALSSVVLVRADVTQNLHAEQALLKKFNLLGPPAILFFGPDQRERQSYRVIGYMEAEKFLAQLGIVKK
ncbi:MAG: protein-disulfide reductase DsbD [Methylobacter tundripaludum]|uniref:Thiol:disulfide interchange protein DsbD n=1 Tax=Methylobacter tundripaludum TaxID=173365 RepID=A0A2S6GVX6_9GAMM|nr:protein-disulfide reductase DsbD [Methylobacter tundripaludum]MCK9638225.1 protein-disulfide reductase DsbD [Methylobacter tundripaludum]PPK69353.1 thiol:disulfide interchange protein DsbD [Methylobacter tundripaludum]